MYSGTDVNFFKLNLGSKYLVLFYYAIILFVGNEITPTTDSQTIFASLVVILGAITNAFIFGNMAALMAAINRKDSQF
jgi:hypothetical protein